MAQTLGGWRFTGVVVGALAAMAVAAIATLGAGEEGLRFIVRWTGRASTALFALAFGASSAFALWRTEATTWLRRNRRYVGVSFAGSQTIHLGALVGLAIVAPGFVEGVEASTLVVGGMAFVFTFLLAATSSDAAMRALGPRWHTLHLVGSWWIFAVFAITILPVATHGPVRAVLALLLVSALVGRMAARRRVRSPLVA